MCFWKMYLLCIKVKQGHLRGPPDKFNAYVTLKVQNLKSTTLPRRGNEPLWEQDFMFEINDLEKGLFVEVWDKGLIWDTFLGSAWIPLSSVERGTQEGPGKWWPLHDDVIMEGNEICRAENPPPDHHHEILLDIYYELPTEIPEDEAHFLIQRLKALYKDEDKHQVSGEEQDYTKGLDNNGDVAGDTILFSPAGAPSEDQDSDYRSEPSPTSLCAAAHPGHTPLQTESLTPGPDHTKGNTRSRDDIDLALGQRNEIETCSTCSWTPSSQLSPGSRVPLDLTDSYSVDCSSATFSQVTPEASFSEASESEVLADSSAVPKVVSPSPSQSPQTPSSPSPHPQRDSTIYCNPTPPCGIPTPQEGSPTHSGGSPTQRPLEQSEEDTQTVSQGNGAEKEIKTWAYERSL